MKIIIKLSIFIFFIFVKPDTKAAGFKCVKFFIEFTLDNDQTIQGFYLSGNYEDQFNFQEETFIAYLQNYANYGSDSIKIFKKIDTLKYPQLDFNKFDSCDFKLSCAFPDAIIYLKINEIKSVRLIKIFPCGVCGIDDEQDGYYWNGLSPQVIIDLTNKEIELLKNTKPYSNCDFLSDEGTSAYYITNYNNMISQNDFKEICLEIKNKLKSGLYNEIKSDLRLKNIVLIKVDFAN